MYDFRTPPSIDNVSMMYNDYYINFTLKNLLVSRNVGYQFVEVNKIHIPDTVGQMMWERYISDPYINKYIDKKGDLGVDIIQNGYFWPFVVYVKNGEYYIREGVHRLYSLNLCINNNIVEDNYKVFCIILDDKNISINPFKIYYPIEYKYCKNKIITDKVCDKAYCDTLNNGRIVDVYTGEKTIYHKNDIQFSINSWPAFLRDLIYKYNNIKANMLINNEKYFNNWIRDINAY